MSENWYNNFMNSTGFDIKPKMPESIAKTGKKEQTFIKNYDGADSQPKPAKLGVPGTITGPGNIVTGTMPLKDSIAPKNQPYKDPYPESNVLLQKNGIQPVYPTQQSDWQAVAVGNDIAPSKQLNAPASTFIPDSKPTGGFKVEWMKAVSENRNLTYAYAATGFGAIAILSGGVFVVKKGSKYEKQYAAVAGISTVLALILLGIFYTSDEESSKSEKQLAGYEENQRKVLEKTNFSPPFNPLQRDQTTPKVYQHQNDAENTVQDRYNIQGKNTKTMEGPRDNTGYRRQIPTPDQRKTIGSKDLMRSPGNYNMDDGTFNEYMRRMNGESIPQLVKSHPYYTFNAEWDHRSQIDDSDRFFGITDEPSQMLRKSIYRQPKIQQAGAKRMHLKDPPPGSVQPLQKIHPMMDQDMQQTGPAFLAGPTSEKMSGSTNEQPIFDDIKIPDMSNEAKIINAQDLLKERMSLNPADNLQQVDKDFLKQENVMSERKRAILSGQFSLPPEREALNMKEVPNHEPPKTIKLDQGRVIPPNQLPAPLETQKLSENSEIKNSIHLTPEENQPVNQEKPSVVEDSENAFLSAFLEKTTPSQSVVDSAIQNSR